MKIENETTFMLKMPQRRIKALDVQNETRQNHRAFGEYPSSAGAVQNQRAKFKNGSAKFAPKISILKLLKNENSEKRNFQNCSKSQQICMFLKGGKTDKWMQMPNLIKTNLKMHSTKLQNSTQNARKSHKIQNSQNRLKLKWKRKVRKSLGKKWEKWQYFGKVPFTAYFRKSQNRKNEKSESSPPI